MNSTCLNLRALSLPRLEVIDIRESSVWENMSYIPVASSIKGAADLLIATARLVKVVFFSVLFVVFALPLGILNDIRAGFQVFGPLHQSWSPTPFSTYFVDKFINHYLAKELPEIASLFGRGILESVPVAGNLTLGFLEGKIKLLTNE